MNALALLRSRFAPVLGVWVDDPTELLEMIRPSQDPKFGDYQANCAMPLGKRLGKPPREVAQDIVDRVDVGDLCDPPEIAGPGFINLRLTDTRIEACLVAALQDEDRLGVEPTARPRVFVMDYSSPNVAKPMHVGHIRSTFIGDSLYRILQFLGHRTISDNHIGDWGTQFGMILFGYKHFLEERCYRDSPVEELGRLYRHVNQLVEYYEARNTAIPKLEHQIAEARSQHDSLADAKQPGEKKRAAPLRQLATRIHDWEADLARKQAAVATVEETPELVALASGHPDIGRDVLAETTQLHAGDDRNVSLWSEFLPPCLAEIDKVYRRLGVSFDHALGESFYHERLGPLVDGLCESGVARESDGATCVFLPDHATPMIIRKQDGAFLYATTDLATIQYRMEEFRPDVILYVVDHRQSLHFQQLFEVARMMGYGDVGLEHISFGTVMGDDGRPFKTRSGDAVGLEGLLDEAVRRALKTVSENDAAKPTPELGSDQRQRIAEIVGIGALKYADLSQNRTSDYVFSFDKMLAMKGNTATYLQYSYARVQSIVNKSQVPVQALRESGDRLRIEQPAERALGLELLRLNESLQRAAEDYRPNHLTNYLFDVASRYAEFYEKCPVLKAETDATRYSRLQLCDLTGRTLKLGLSLLGIDVVDKM